MSLIGAYGSSELLINPAIRASDVMTGTVKSIFGGENDFFGFGGLGSAEAGSRCQHGNDRAANALPLG